MHAKGTVVSLYPTHTRERGTDVPCYYDYKYTIVQPIHHRKYTIPYTFYYSTNLQSSWQQNGRIMYYDVCQCVIFRVQLQSLKFFSSNNYNNDIQGVP